jgi:hypothetical protein
MRGLFGGKAEILFQLDPTQDIDTQKRIKRAEIARRYKFLNSHRTKTKPSLPSLRTAELDRWFTHLYGHRLPDDDAGRDDVRIMAHHLAAISPVKAPQLILNWISVRASWMAENEVAYLVEEVGRWPCRWTASELGKALGLTYDLRQQLRIRTIRAIDCLSKAAMTKRRKRRHAETEKARRRANGAANQSLSINRQKPWVAAGMGRTKWYEERRRTTSCPIKVRETTAHELVRNLSHRVL